MRHHVGSPDLTFKDDSCIYTRGNLVKELKSLNAVSLSGSSMKTSAQCSAL